MTSPEANVREGMQAGPVARMKVRKAGEQPEPQEKIRGTVRWRWLRLRDERIISTAYQRNGKNNGGLNNIKKQS